jgi:hypothetical protein
MAVSLPCALGLSAVLFIMGLTGAFQVSSSRAVMERLHARRLIEAGASSAFEEACATLENSLPAQPLGAVGQPRDLGESLPWPAEVVPVVARADLAGQGITLSDVSVHSSPWVFVDTPDEDEEGGGVVQEVGLLDLSVKVKATVGSTTLERRVLVRRYVSAGVEPEEDECRVWIQSANLYQEVSEP